MRAELNAPSLRWSILAAILSVGALIALSVVYYYAFGEYRRDSDQVNTFLMAQDIVNGNLSGHHWWISDDNFWFLDVSFEALLIALLGVHPKVMVLAPAIMWAVVVVMSALACVREKDRSLAGLLVVLTLLGLPILRQNDAMQLIGRSPIHVASTVCMLAMMLLSARLMEAGSRPALVAVMGLITVLGTSSDPLIMVIGSGAIVVVAGLDVLGGVRRQHVVVLATIIGATLAGRIGILVAQKLGGLSAYHLPLRFVELKDLGANLWLGLFSLLMLTGTNFFGRTIPHALPFVVRLPFLGMLIWALVFTGNRYARNLAAFGLYRRLKPLDRILLMAVLINVAAGLLSELLHGPAESRYFYPALVFAAILCARAMPNLRWLNLVAGAAFACSLVFTVRDYVRTPPTVVVLEPSVTQLADRLISEHLTLGYASYWSASVATVASRNQVAVRAVEVNSAGRIVPKLWNSNSDWYENFAGSRPFFVLADKRDVEARLSGKMIVGTFGEPTSRISLQDFNVLVYR